MTSTDMIQLTWTQKMTTAQVVETSVTVNNSPIQDFVHPDDHAQPTYERRPPWWGLAGLLTAYTSQNIKPLHQIIIHFFPDRVCSCS